MRRYRLGDRLFDEFQQCIRTIAGGHPDIEPLHTLLEKESPPTTHPKRDTDEIEARRRKESANLLRVNHAGEIAAQALYRGQALTTSNPALRRELLRAAKEEIPHLLWCKQRLDQLDDHISRFAVFWYAGSLVFGCLAGTLDEAKALGFVEETELQVARHLENHLSKLPKCDWRSAVVLRRMLRDELQHARWARDNQAIKPGSVGQSIMHVVSRVMVVVSYRF